MLTTASRIFKYGIANRKGTGISINYVSVLERQKETSGEQTETGEKLYVGLHEVTEKEVLNPEEIKRVILATKPGFYRTVIQTAIYTGARVSEILALRWDDVDLDNSTVYIRRSMSTARVKGEAGQERVRWFDPKTTRGTRTIPVDMDLTRSLNHGKKSVPRVGSIWYSQTSLANPSDRTGIGRYGLTPALNQAGIDKKISMHSLRHTYASVLIHLGRKITQVSKYLGHKDVEVTMRIYTHFINETKKQDDMSDFGKLIENA